MVAYLLDNIPLNVGQFVIFDIRHTRTKSGPRLMFLSLITDLWKKVEFKEYPRDNKVSLKKTICHLKIRDKGALSKGKEKKMDLGNLVDDDIDPCRHLWLGHLGRSKVR